MHVLFFDHVSQSYLETQFSIGKSAPFCLNSIHPLPESFFKDGCHEGGNVPCSGNFINVDAWVPLQIYYLISLICYSKHISLKPTRISSPICWNYIYVFVVLDCYVPWFDRSRTPRIPLLGECFFFFFCDEFYCL